MAHKAVIVFEISCYILRIVFEIYLLTKFFLEIGKNTTHCGMG